MKLEWKALPHPPFNNSRQHLYHATRSFFSQRNLAQPPPNKPPPSPRPPPKMVRTHSVVHLCHAMSSLFTKEHCWTPATSSLPHPPPLGWMSTHQHTMQDGCCVDRQHFFINILCPIVNGVSYVLTIHMHASTCLVATKSHKYLIIYIIIT
jgi:hypothetical protein